MNMGIRYLLGGTIWMIPVPVLRSIIIFHFFDIWNSISGYRSWYGISVCICRFVVYWVVIMVPILFCFSSSTILFLLLSEMVLLITDPGDHNNSYPGCFPLSAILFLSRSTTVSASPEDEVKSKHADILDWGEDIISINRLKYAERWKRDQSSRNSEVSSSSLASQIRMWCIWGFAVFFPVVFFWGWSNLLYYF